MDLATTFLLRASVAVFTVLGVPAAASAYTVKENASGRIVRWKCRELTLRVDPALVAMLPEGRVIEAARHAAEAWRGFEGVPDVLIEEGAPPELDLERRGMGIYLVHDWPLDDALAVTRSTVSEPGFIVGVDIWVNAAHWFTVHDEGHTAKAREGAYDLEALLTHELGHVLGLGETDSDPDATMWPHMSPGETGKRTPELDDEEGLVALYAGERVTREDLPPDAHVAALGEAPRELPAQSCSVPGAGGARRPAALVLAVVLVAAAGLRRRRVAPVARSPLSSEARTRRGSLPAGRLTQGDAGAS